MAKSLKSLLSKINLVDLAVVLVLISVLMCLMKKMNIVEGLCGLSQAGQEKILSGSSTKTQEEQVVECSNLDDSDCSIIEDNVEMCTTGGMDELDPEEGRGPIVAADRDIVNIRDYFIPRTYGVDERGTRDNPNHELCKNMFEGNARYYFNQEDIGDSLNNALNADFYDHNKDDTLCGSPCKYSQICSSYENSSRIGFDCTDWYLSRDTDPQLDELRTLRNVSLNGELVPGSRGYNPSAGPRALQSLCSEAAWETPGLRNMCYSTMPCQLWRWKNGL